MNDKTLRVLLIEDDRVDAMAFTRFVEREKLPYEYMVSPSISDAREVLSKSSFDIAIADYQLGDGTCLDLFDALVDTPTIVVTGSGDEKTAVTAMKRGARDYIIKDPQGYYLTILPSTVRNVLERCEVEAELKRYRENLEVLVQQRTNELSQVNLALIDEIAEHKRTEASLRKSEDRYRRITQAVTDYIYTVRVENGRAVETVHGPACEAVTGYTSEEYKRDPGLWIRMVHDEDREAVFRQASCVLSGQTPDPLEHRIRHKDGSIHWVQNTNVLHYDSQGRLISYDGLVRDITERKQSEHEKDMLREQLHQAQKMEAVGQLAAGVAHDFNNMLTVVAINAERIRRIYTDPVLQEVANMILESVDQASGVTKSLLTFSREIPGERKLLNLSDVVRRATLLLSKLLPASIEMKTACEEDCWICGDSVQIQQVILNLAINARDAMPEKGCLKIELLRERSNNGQDSDEPRDIHLKISDTGVGMAPEVKRRIFEPFFSTKPRGQGTGLGLAIVHGILENHDARISVTSECGKGTEFAITFPAASAYGESEVHLPEPTQLGAGECILIADDHTYLCSLIMSSLVENGYQVIAARDGEELLDRFHRHANEISLLIADIEMPKIGGIACLKIIRRETESLPVILITGSLIPDSEIPLGPCTKLLRKPFNLATLTITVSNMLNATVGKE